MLASRQRGLVTVYSVGADADEGLSEIHQVEGIFGSQERQRMEGYGSLGFLNKLWIFV